MATEIVRTFLRGWLIQDPRLALPACIWSAHSSYTQAGPMAGLAVYDPTTTDLVLSATGTQTTATTLQVYSLDPGLVLDGSYCWKLSTASLWYGWETPITLSGWEAWEWTDGSGPLGILSTAKPHALTLPDGSVLCVVEAVRTVPGPITTYEVLCYKRNPTTGAITSSVVRLTSSAPVDGKHPCLLRNPNSGRLLCYSWLEAGATAQVYVCYSDDDGATWSVATRHGIKTCQNYVGSAKDAFVDTSSAPGAGAAGFALGRLRACWGRGGVMLLAGLVANNTSHAQDYLVQFASTDDGAVFNEVGRSGYAAVGPTSGAVWFDVVWNGSVFVVGMIEDAYGFPTAKRIPSVDSDISQWPEITVTPTGFATTAYWGTPYAGPITDSDCSLVLSDSGEIYFLGRIPGLTSECPIFVSTDGGITWRQLGNAPVGLAIESYGQWWTCGDSATHPKGLAGTWQHGRILCLHNWDAAPGNEDNSLGCAFLGGFSTQTLPNYIGAMGSWPDQVAWSLTWLPFDLPGDCLWTRTSTGGTDVLATGGLDLDSTAGTIWYERALTGTVAQGGMAKAVLTPVTGGSLATNTIYLRIRLWSATQFYSVAIYLSTAGLACWDEVGAGVQLGTAAVVTTAGIQIRLSVQGGVASCRYRIPSSPGDEARTWVQLVNAAAIVDGGAVANTQAVEWGHRGGVATSKWIQVVAVSAAWAGGTSAAGQSNPADLQGRLYSTTPSYVGAGISLTAESGPTMTGDEASFTTRYSYPIDNIFASVEPSPRIPWRSTSDAAPCQIALRLDPTLTADSGAGGSLLSLWLQNIGSANRYELQGLPFGGAWATIHTLYSDSGLNGLHWTRTGNTVQSDGTTAGPYIHMDEFKDCWFLTATGGQGKFWRITHNTEGSLGTGHKRATLFIEDAIAADPTAGATGSLRANWVSGLVKVGTADYSAYRILIPAQDTYENYFTIGTHLLGWVVVFGSEYSFGRSIELEPNRDEDEAADWTYTDRSLAPARRAVEIGFTDGVYTDGAYSGDQDWVQDRTTATGGVAVATTRDTPFQLQGLFRSMAGPGVILGYLPAIPYAGATATFNRYWQGILLRTLGALTLEPAQGKEGVDELIRIAKVSCVEVV